MKMFKRYYYYVLVSLWIVVFNYGHCTPLIKQKLRHYRPPFNKTNTFYIPGHKPIREVQGFVDIANFKNRFSHSVNSGENKDTKGKDENLINYHLEAINFQEDLSSAWPLGIILYDFDETFDSILAQRVRSVMDYLESVSCVQFKALSRRIPGHPWVHIKSHKSRRECSHKPKMKRSGEIVLILGLDCLMRRDILHSLLHAIGLTDEVTHPYRDQYVRILWENLQTRYHDLFDVKPRPARMLMEYDPSSVMQFHDRAFSRNGQATIALLMPGLQIQPSDKLSHVDKLKLRAAFGHECNRRTVDGIFDTCKSVIRQASQEDTDVEKMLAFAEIPSKPKKPHGSHAHHG